MVVDAQFEAGRTPIDELDCPAHLYLRDGLVCITGDDITTVQQSTSHVMRCSGITDDHLIMRLETLEGDILDAMGFMLGLCLGDDGCTGDERIVNSGVGDEVSLEFSQIDVQGTFKTEGRRDGGDDCVLDDASADIPCAMRRLRLS